MVQFGVMPSAPPIDDDPKNELLINIPINTDTDSDISHDTIVVRDSEPIYKWCLIYFGVFAVGGIGICLLVYFFWH